MEEFSCHFLYFVTESSGGKIVRILGNVVFTKEVRVSNSGAPMVPTADFIINKVIRWSALSKSDLNG